MHQYYGDIAQSKLSDLILGKKVYFETLSRDKYGRYVSKVKYNNRLLDRWLVKEGLSWVYPLYCKDKQLYKLEKTARENKKGLWATESPEPPWEYRKKKRSE
jgi:endonuclease YncB( thermonuclease family)